jgi:hypothetical protein
MHISKLEKRQFLAPNFCRIWSNIPGSANRNQCLNNWSAYCFGINFNTIAPQPIFGNPLSEGTRQAACFQRIATFQPSELPGRCGVICNPRGGVVTCNGQDILFLPGNDCTTMQNAIATRGRFWFLTDGQLAGVIIGCLVFLGLILGICGYAFMKKRKEKQTIVNQTNVHNIPPAPSMTRNSWGPSYTKYGPAPSKMNRFSGTSSIGSSPIINNKKEEYTDIDMGKDKRKTQKLNQKFDKIDKLGKLDKLDKSIPLNPSSILKAKSSFRTMNAGYLNVNIGDEFGIIEDMGDGWVMARNESTLKTGLIPRSCLNLQ